LRVAINGAYVTLDDAVRAGDEVAVIPPVAGG
jgi:molybdopterin converting factor small subunit